MSLGTDRTPWRTEIDLGPPVQASAPKKAAVAAPKKSSGKSTRGWLGGEGGPQTDL